MLRVGLTGDLGSGKSTVAKMFAEHGAVVLSSDEMGRAMMQPGQAVYDAIVACFGGAIVAADGSLNRRALAQLAFDPKHPRVAELNAIVHPAVIAAQAAHVAARRETQPRAIVVIESALIFTTKHAGEDEPWRHRFDRIVLVTAPEEQKIARFVERALGGQNLSLEERAPFEADARGRLALQHVTADQARECLVIHNKGSVAELQEQVEAAWSEFLLLEERAFREWSPSSKLLPPKR